VESRDTCLVSRLSRDVVFHVSVSTLVYLILARVSSFCVSSCLVSRECVLTVSQSAYSALKHWHFLLKEGHPANLLAVYLLTVKRLFLWLLPYGYDVF